MKAKIFTIFFLITASAFAQIPSNGLAAFFPFSSNARDSSSNKTHGTTSNVVLTTDRYGNANCAFRFFGTANSFISFPAGNLTNHKYTYSLWAQIIENPAMGEMAFALNVGSTGGDQSLNIANNYSGGYNGWLGGGYNTTSPNFGLNQNTPLNGMWNHIVCVRDSNFALLYVNGVLQDSLGSSTVKIPSYGSGNVMARIGIRNNGVSAFNGKIDDVIIYDRPLSKQEVIQLFNDNSTSIDKISFKSIKLEIYPNPNFGSFHLNLDLKNTSVDDFKISITNILGVEMPFTYVQVDDSSLEIEHQLPAGIYFVNVYDKAGKVSGTEKLIVN